jgi:hypothetical protein
LLECGFLRLYLLGFLLGSQDGTIAKAALGKVRTEDYDFFSVADINIKKGRGKDAETKKDKQDFGFHHILLHTLPRLSQG